MPHIVVLPHIEYCSGGAIIEAKPGTTICDALLGAGIEIEHAYEKSCTCTTRHAIVRGSFSPLDEATKKEENLLDRAWGLEPNSRLSYQAKATELDLTVEIPKHMINHVKGNRRTEQPVVEEVHYETERYPADRRSAVRQVLRR